MSPMLCPALQAEGPEGPFAAGLASITPSFLSSPLSEGASSSEPGAPGERGDICFLAFNYFDTRSSSVRQGAHGWERHVVKDQVTYSGRLMDLSNS